MLTNAQQQEIALANEYFGKGEKEKAYELFKSLAKQNENGPLIHSNYLNLLLTMGKFKEAEDHVERMIKRDGGNLNYRVDLGLVYVKQGDQAKAEKYLKSLIKVSLDEPFKVKLVCDHLVANGLAEFAELGYQQVREALNSPTAFALEMANIYRIRGKRDEMVAEYLNYVTQSPSNINYIKNLLQALLSKPDELESLERILIQKVQRFPDTEVYTDLLIWVSQQQKNFYQAFIQARAFDKRFGKGSPKKTYEIAQVAFLNNDFENAYRSYQSIVKDFQASEEYLPSRLGLIRSTEAQIKQRYPVNLDSIRLLTPEYKKIVRQFPDHPTAFESLVAVAKLHAYFLSEIDSALVLLQNVIQSPRAPVITKARAKLETGDLFLLKDEPWEATLVYSQVEKAQKDAQLGYEAKLRNAKLNYYRGDFKLAEAHLDILKEATTREIANDAMELSLRIKENTIADSLGQALRVYAQVEKLILQNKTEAALQKLDELKAGTINLQADSTLTVYNASILDDVYWLESKLRMRNGQFVECIALLQKILDEYPDDVLADDAYFTQADIYHNYLNDKVKAQAIYQDILMKYPGSVYAAEARKRFRQLRGDFTIP